MALKLVLGKRDKLEMGGITVTVQTLRGDSVCLEVDAPKSVEVNRVYHNKAQQKENIRLQEARKRAHSDYMVELGQTLTPEEQRQLALIAMRRRNGQ